MPLFAHDKGVELTAPASRWRPRRVSGPAVGL